MITRTSYGIRVLVSSTVLAGILCHGPSTIAVPPGYTESDPPIVYPDATVTSAALRPERVEDLSNGAESSFALLAAGADTCNLATVTPVPVGPPGNPVTVTIVGDSSPATLGLECLASYEPWWEAFEITSCATVTIDLCGTVPTH